METQESEVRTRVSEKDRKDIAEMTETSKYLEGHDPQGILIAKSNMNILKARAEMEKQEECKEDI